MDVRALTDSEFESNISALSHILCDCVAGGASISFMSSFSMNEADAYWQAILKRSRAHELIVFGAFLEGTLVGTATLITSTPPNQPHRADVAKVLVSPAFQRRGIAKALMLELENHALNIGKDLLVLDTITGSGAESLYAGLGWSRVGEIPRYALMPDGEPRATTVFYKDLGRGKWIKAFGHH